MAQQVTISANDIFGRINELLASWVLTIKHRFGVDGTGKEDYELLEGEMTWEEVEENLRSYERDYGMSSAEFYAKFRRGEMPDTYDTSAWAIEYSFWRDSKRGRARQGQP